MEKSDFFMPQQRLGVAAGFRSHILLGTHPVSAKARIHSSGRICQMRCALAAQSLTLPPGPGWGAAQSAANTTI